MNMRTKEAIRYLGYGKNNVEDRIIQMIQESFAELDALANRKIVHRIFEIQFNGDDEIVIANMVIKSRKLFRNLYGCKNIILFAATLGTEVDRLIRKYERIDIAKAVVAQACATTILEEYCDEWQEKISMNLRPRFSPGYGDFSILHQKDILNLLEASKKIGLSMTDGYMLTPTKSVTAVIGIGNANEICHIKGCEACEKTDCTYRRS